MATTRYEDRVASAMGIAGHAAVKLEEKWDPSTSSGQGDEKWERNEIARGEKRDRKWEMKWIIS